MKGIFFRIFLMHYDDKYENIKHPKKNCATLVQKNKIAKFIGIKKESDKKKITSGTAIN